MLRPIVIATAIAGTLDLIAACVFAGLAGMGPIEVLQFVASGPFGDGALTNTGFAVAGFLVHFGIMTCMVTAYMFAAQRQPLLLRQPIAAGITYGLFLWFVMYWIVRPMRWESLPPPTDPKAIAAQWFCHLILVGLPIAFVAVPHLRPAQPSPAADQAGAEA